MKEKRRGQDGALQVDPLDIYSPSIRKEVWYAYFSQKYQREFYYNPVSQQRTWILPSQVRLASIYDYDKGERVTSDYPRNLRLPSLEKKRGNWGLLNLSVVLFFLVLVAFFVSSEFEADSFVSTIRNMQEHFRHELRPSLSPVMKPTASRVITIAPIRAPKCWIEENPLVPSSGDTVESESIKPPIEPKVHDIETRKPSDNQIRITRAETIVQHLVQNSFPLVYIAL